MTINFFSNKTFSLRENSYWSKTLGKAFQAFSRVLDSFFLVMMKYDQIELNYTTEITNGSFLFQEWWWFLDVAYV
jgi:hypothetical protein